MQSVAKIGVGTVVVGDIVPQVINKTKVRRFGETIAGIIFSLIALALFRSLRFNSVKAKK
jgi:hypothetical protein